MNKKKEQQSIVIYKTAEGEVGLKVRFENESVWLQQHQIAKLFDKERSVITKHINKILKDGEVNEQSNVQKVHIANSDKPVALYSLDIVLAVGYRTNSSKAIRFRKWATQVLKNYLFQGYVLNQKRLEDAQGKFRELQQTISFLQKNAAKKQLKGQEQEIINLLADYSKTLSLLEEYDKRKIKKPKGKRLSKKTKFVLKYEVASSVLVQVKKNLIEKKEATDLFGRERDKGLESILKNLYQTYCVIPFRVFLG